LVGGAHQPLQGGEVIANGDAWVQWNSSVGANGSYILLECTGGALQVSNATQSSHAINLGQADQRYTLRNINNLDYQRVLNSSGTPGRVLGMNAQNIFILGDIDNIAQSVVLQAGGATVFTLDASGASISNGKYLRAINSSNSVGRILGINNQNQIYLGDIDGIASLLSIQIAGSSIATGTASGLALSGTPTAPTAALGTNTTQIASAAFVQSSLTGRVGSTNLRAYLSAASNTISVTADEIVAETAIGGQQYKLSAFSKSLNLSTTGIGGMDAGQAPATGFIAIYAAYNPSNGQSGVFACNAASAAGEVYGGSNAPTGYSATALLTVVPTNSSRQISPVLVQGRRVSIPYSYVINTTVQSGSLTSLNIQSAVPANAKSASGFVNYGSAIANWSIGIAADTVGVGFNYINNNNSNGGAQQFSVACATAQTISYQWTASNASSGTPALQIAINGYEI
ncbi:hypothetical protein, partial [Chromobacterium violaceum]|uniref:hypothetical protein n=1 Tax=Chromobacterium violaceum TaxID=536 RepID=UPI001C3C9658